MVGLVRDRYPGINRVAKSTASQQNVGCAGAWAPYDTLLHLSGSLLVRKSDRTRKKIVPLSHRTKAAGVPDVLRCATLTKKSSQVIKNRQGHQPADHNNPKPLPYFHPALWRGLAADHLDHVVHQMTAIEHRDGQQV